MSIGVEWQAAEMSLEEKNAMLRQAVEQRLGGCCEGERMCYVDPEHPVMADPDDESEDVADPIHEQMHPSTRAFQQAVSGVWQMHRSKSHDYGSGTDPLANIRNGATFVGIPAWQGAMVRLSDKVTRLATFNATGRLGHEGVEDTLLDLASYALLALLLYQEEQKSA